MAAVDVGSRNAPPAPTDDLDDLFDYDVPNDIFEDVEQDMEAPVKPAKGPFGSGSGSAGGLGLDEEVKVTKKRAPIPKLDEERLLSRAGIPKLRQMAREKMKFRGKGHEYSDVARLLNIYQFWLDDLYPRAKFADGLVIIEKLGHSKRMQLMRKEWINEGKPRDIHQEMEEGTLGEQSHPKATNDSQKLRVQDSMMTGLPPPAEEHSNNVNTSERRQAGTDSHVASHQNDLFLSDEQDENIDDGGQPPLDDLDELLAEDAKRSGVPDSKKTLMQDNFDDEMEAMAGLDDMW